MRILRVIIMDGRENILDPEDLSVVHPGELSLSSGVISLPSANRLADLSLASDITDSEVENEATVQIFSACGYEDHSNDRQYEKYVKVVNSFSMESSMLPHSQRLSDSLKSDPDMNDKLSEAPSLITKERTRHDGSVPNGKSFKIGSNMNVIEDERITGMPTISLDDVRTALQQNCSLLNDRHLLKDLLKSLDDKIEQEPTGNVSIRPQFPGNKQQITSDQKNFLVSNFKENPKELVFNQSVMSSPKSLSINYVSNGNIDNRNRMVDGVEALVNLQVEPPDGPRTSETPQENFHVALFNSSLVEQEALQKCSDKPATHSDLGKHVKFQSTTTTTQDPLVQIEGKKYGDKLDSGAQQSLNVMKKLAGLRWGLMGWEDVSNSPPTDSSSSLTFLYHLLTSLQSLKLEKKHLKEELTTTLKKFKDLSEESNTKQNMYEKREARLIEADRQLGELQQAWAAAHETGQQETAKLRAKCHVLKQENDLLRKEDQCLRNDVMELKSITQQHALMKTQMLETEELLAASKKKTAEVLEENNRVNLCLEENKKYIQELEEMKIPQLLNELEDVKVRAGRLEDSNKRLSQAKAQLEEDAHMLQEQHKLLLKKVVDEQENKAITEQRKTVLEDEVKDLSEKMIAMKTQLHLHYQAQVEDLVARKSAALQEQLKTLESSLQKNFEEQLKTQMENHQIACKKLQERYEEKIKDMKSSYEKQLEKLHCEMKEVEQENHRLHQQKKGVISAVSSILGLEHQTSVNPSSCWSLTVPGSSRQAGGSISSLDEVKDGFLKAETHPTRCTTHESGENVGNMAGLPFHSSSSSDTESTMFPEGKQTVRHLDGHSLCALPSNGMSPNGYHKNHSKNSVSSPVIEFNPEQGACDECQAFSALHMKTNAPQTQVTSYSAHLGIGNYSRNGSTSLKLNLDQNCKKQKKIDHKKSSFPLFTSKIKKASEIIQATELTDEDVSYQDGDEILFGSEEDEEMARIFKELRMQVNQSTQGPQSDVPTHDTSLDQDPASITLHRLSQVSSVLSQYVTHS
ncbi:uncharacterized protein LOC135114052 [Scylla paramamosain]|uniref:uncharacterized protein LOC135114052 n=1 Tax=Scylla paramamosain TaxID=85552 RepID=UPI003082DA9A